MLVFKKREKKKNFSELHKLIFGYPKIGKSTFCAQMSHDGKTPAFISTEDGLGALEVNSARIRDFKSFEALVKEVASKKEEYIKAHSCFILDLASDLEKMAEKHTCNVAKVKSLSDGAWGKLYDEMEQSLNENVKKLMDILPCVFVAHTQEKEVNYQGHTIQTHAYLLGKRFGNFVNGKVDVSGFIYIDEKGKTSITFTPSKMAIAGSRFKQLRGKDFELDPNDMRKSYEEITKTFNGGKK